MNVLGYVITATRDDGTRWYMAIDRTSGGYEYFTGASPGAEMYPTETEAREQAGKRMGVTFWHNASGADFAHPQRTVELRVERVDAVPVGDAIRHTSTITR